MSQGLALESGEFIPAEELNKMMNAKSKCATGVKADEVEFRQPLGTQQPAAHVQNPAEIENVAGDVSKNGAESNMAQQPAPSEQQPFGWIKQSEIDSSNDFGGSINLWRRKYDCDVPVYLAQQPAPSAARPVTPYTCPKCHALWLHWPAEQTGFGRDTLNCRSADHCHYCEKAGVEQLQRLERVPAALTAPQPAPTPQADSQPAPQGETNAQLDIDSNSSAPGQQRDVAGSVALGQPVGNGSDQAAGHTGAQGDKLLIVAERNIRSFLRSAVFKSESDREAALNCVDVLWEAASAPADNVTAPAGGAVSTPVFAFRRKGLDDFCTCTEERYAELSAKPSLFETCIFYTTPPAQAADSVLEDADPLQGAANWLAEAHGQFGVAVLQGGLLIGYNRAKRLHDAAIAARKQGGA